MIRVCEAADEDRVLAAACAVPAVGDRLWVDWHLLRENPAMPYRFYLADGAVLENTGRGVTVLGQVNDPEELAAWLDFTGVDNVMGWVPPGWRANTLQVMFREGANADEVASRSDDELVFDDDPPIGEVMAVLESSEAMPQPMRDGFYADLCTRLNHGYAWVCGVVSPDGGLLSTAGAYCITPTGVYLSGVETRPAARGRGHAAALVRRLCARFAGRRVGLVCHAPLVPFYEKLGFVLGTPVQTGRRPA